MDVGGSAVSGTTVEGACEKSNPLPLFKGKIPHIHHRNNNKYIHSECQEDYNSRLPAMAYEIVLLLTYSRPPPIGIP